ncbi:beta strand repeat-containing protein [Asaia astilbis]
MTTNSQQTLTDIYTNPSVNGPNLQMNTQDVDNGQIVYNDTISDLDGGVSPDWAVIQWNGATALDPLAGDGTQVWDNNFGYSVGHWTQGSSTSVSGKTSYNVFRDPDNGHYIYQMAAQGGHFLDVQISAIKAVDGQYSFNHQLTASLAQGISGYQGTTGVYQAGVNFTINFHSATMSFGLFLQFESVDYKGIPQAYASFPKSLGGSIYNVSGSQAAYINPKDASTDGVMYNTTIDLNQGLMAAIKAMVTVYPDLAGQLEDLSNWYLSGMYIGVESIGTGLSTDVTGNYNVEDPTLTYDTSKTVSYSDLSRTAPIVTMTPKEGTGNTSVSTAASEEVTMPNIVVKGVNNTVYVPYTSGDTAGTMAKSYASSLQSLIAAETLDNSILTPGSNSFVSSQKASQAIIDTAGSYGVSGNYSNIVIASTSSETLTGAVTLDTTQNTASNLNIVSGNQYGSNVKVGNSSGSFAGTQGNNVFNATGSTGNWSIATGAGNDTIYGANGTNTITGGAGSNLIYLGGSNNYVTSLGTDTIYGAAGAIDTVSLQGGNSTANLKTNAAVIDLSTGNKITVGDNSSVFGGSSSVVNVTSGSATVTGTQGDTITAAGDLEVVHGSNQNISVTGALNFISGTGQTTISAGSATIFGADQLTATLSSPSRLLFTANQPYTTGTQLIDGRNVAGGLSAWTGAGSQTVIGGSASDQFYLGTAFQGVDGATAAATVTGGTGAGNLFGMLVNHTAGNFTITDFRAADNKFFLYNYKPADSNAAAQSILNTATVSGGNTSVMIDGTAKITFLGVTDLKVSDFTIS